MGNVNKVLNTIGLPPLGERWTGGQIAVGVAVVVLALPIALLAALTLGLWRWATRPPGVSSGQAREGRGGGGAYHGPYGPQATGPTRECLHCRSSIYFWASACPYCGRDT